MVVNNLVKQGWRRVISGKKKLYTLLLALVASVLVGCSGAGTSEGGGSSRTIGIIGLTANAGPIVAVRVGNVAIFDGRSSTAPATQQISYSWALVSKPEGSAATLNNPNSSLSSLLADVRGIYTVELIVRAGGVNSERTVGIAIATNPDEDATGGSYSHLTLSSNCINCHNGTDATAGPKSGDHMATTNLCQACHAPAGFTVIAYVDHKEVFGNCSTCHDGVTAIGKSERHVPTAEECSDCHNSTESFFELELGGSFDHTDINSGCQFCHDGVRAVGKEAADPPHMETDNDCYVCHSTTAWTPAVVDHDGIVDDCARSGCHGSGATGKSLNHPLTSDNCEVCHSIATFVITPPFNHDDLDNEVNSCETCHDGTHTAVGARGKASAPNGHPPTNSDCGNCHNTEDFAVNFVDHTSPEVTTVRCDSCHNNNPVIGLPTPFHMPLTLNQDCGECHTPGNFATGTFDHNPLVVDPVRCDSCHDDTISVGKGVNHVPTNGDCDVCHTIVTFTGASVDHTGIVDGCSTCHDGEVSTGKSDAQPAHIPTSDVCQDCHTVIPLAFTPSTFAHVGINNNCQSCHNGDYTRPGSQGDIILGKHDLHIPTQDDCNACHVIATNFGGATFSHTGIDRGCEGCHNGTFTTASNTILGKPRNPFNPNDETLHILTDQDCYFCHSTDTDWQTSGQALFAHTGISGNCTSCHDGTYLAMGALDKASAPNHPITTADCGACHTTESVPPNGVSFLNYFVDHSDFVNNCTVVGCHDSSTTEGIYAASTQHGPTNGNDCELCHTAGVAWTPAVFDHDNIAPGQRCDSCHNGINATGLSQGHISILDSQGLTRDCSDCHNTTAFAGAAFDHTGITGNCVSCHNGTQATGKDNDHVPTNDDCVVCHTTTGFLPATFDHQGIVDNCESCHNGTFATGKDADHVVTNQDCGVCHNTTAFFPATFDHTGITNNCARSGCHGDGATGKPPTHVPTNLDCSNCHTTATFVGASWDHTGITGNCILCHDGTTATGKGNGHFQTNEDCNACHLTTGWAPVDYNHPNNSLYPGDHNGNVGCTSCHRQNNQDITFQFNYPGTCAACHANDFDAGEHNGGLQNNLNCGDSGCHRVSDRNWD